MDIETIHKSLVNGKRQQMVNQIKEYGPYVFWCDYENYLMGIGDEQNTLRFFTDATISYFMLTDSTEMLNKINFESLDGGTQFKIFDRMMNRTKELTAKQLENNAMEAFAIILLEETQMALTENAGPMVDFS